jgi:cytochrome c5
MKTIAFITLYACSTILMASDLGKETYEIACKTCHAPEPSQGMHAPTAFDKKAWAMRFEEAAEEAQKKPEQFKTPIDYLLYRATIGKGLMPHGGLCKEANKPKENCSDKAITEAIRYMAGIESSN